MMQAGTYYVGDLCYVLHGEWDEVCDRTIEDSECLSGEFTLSDGRRFALYSTAYGDGVYNDNRGRPYCVDAGIIGCILLSDIDLLDDRNFLSCGQVLEFPEDFTTSGSDERSDGVIRFGGVCIDTADHNEEEFENE